MRGKFIVFEGLDASGKETQAKKTVEYLKSKGIDAIYTDEPTSSNPIGLFIKDWLAKKFDINSVKSVALLYAADRYEHLKTVILPALERGTWVVCDRYFYSTLAYETAIFDESIFDWIEDVHKFVLKPDAIFYIDITPEESLRRKPVGDRLERMEVQQKVYDVYKKRIIEKYGMNVINGERPIDEVFGDVRKTLDHLIMSPSP